MSRLPHGLSRLDLLLKCKSDAHAATIPLPATFGRLKKPANPVQLQVLTHEQLIAVLEKIALDMGKETDLSGPAPAGMTFFGQFVDHDITLDATSALGSRIEPATIPNVRTPALDLDCVYGAGPEASPHLYGAGDAKHFLVYGNATCAFDLARTKNGTALIGDPRNDENMVVSQIQANMIALHNILMAKCLEDPAFYADVKGCAHMGMSSNAWAENVPDRNMVFEEVRRFMRMHYQWVVWNELLPAFVDQACLDEARQKDTFGKDAPIMPVEFSGAAYRFGHATTQPDYRLRTSDKAQVDMMTILGFGQRDDVVDMAHFFDIDGKAAQRARPVRPTLGKALTALHFIQDQVELHDIDHTLTLPQSQNLPLRNMIRDRYTYQLTNGEKMAHWLRDELGLHAPEVKIHPHLKKHGITKTPLWLYCLQEAEQHGNGCLTGVGGAIVASVFARLLRLDGTTYWHAHGFKPSAHFENKGGVMAGMMKYAEAHRAHIPHADQLQNG